MTKVEHSTTILKDMMFVTCRYVSLSRPTRQPLKTSPMQRRKTRKLFSLPPNYIPFKDTFKTVQTSSQQRRETSIASTLIESGTLGGKFEHHCLDRVMSHFDLDDSDNSAIHHDSDDEEVERDDDIDIGFRRHQYETVDNGRPKRARKEDALYGVFYEEEKRQPKRAKTSMDPAPMFVSASRTEAAAKPKNENSFVAATKIDVKTNDDDKKDQDKEEPREDSQEEKEIREKQKAADDYFLSLLKKGRGKQRPKPRRSEMEMTKQQFTGGLGMPVSFESMQRQEAQSARIPQSNLGKWEKHTKGIGGKLLAKMGWSGAGGLGSNRRKLKKEAEEEVTEEATETVPSPDAEDVKARKGISRPVEVVVRPAHLGLGFGSFKEASQLKGNRQIEAEVRGIELPSEAKKGKGEDKNDASWGPATSSSAMPGTSELLAQKQWKRVRKAKATKLQVIPYNELIDKQKYDDGQLRIIDMRGAADTRKESKAEDGQVPLGAELLHNMSFLLNTHENKLHSSVHFLKTTTKKCASLTSDIDAMEKRKKEGDERIGKVKATLSVVDEIEGLTQQQHGKENSKVLLRDIQELITRLGAEFTAEERQLLNFWGMLAPAMVSPVIQIQLDNWDMLDANTKKWNESVIDSVFSVGQSKEENGSQALRSLRNSVIENQLLPKIKLALESPRWMPSRDMDAALDVYEYILQKTIDCSPKKSKRPQTRGDAGNVFVSDDEEEIKDALPSTVTRVLMLDTIYPKLQDSLKRWKPSLQHTSQGVQIDERLDLWILPWLQHLDHLNALPNLISDCTKKTKAAIEYLHRMVSSDMEFLRASIDILKPWQIVFGPKAMHRLVSGSVTPRLARYLAKHEIHQNFEQQQWAALQIVFEMHKMGLLSDIDFLSVIEGEILVKWVAMMHTSLVSGDHLSSTVQNYSAWKLHVLTKGALGNGNSIADSSLQLLRQDVYVCSIFYSVLRMIHLAKSASLRDLDEMAVAVTNFRIVLARRTREHQAASEEEFIRFQARSDAETEARVRLQRRNIQTPTFREVVEEFARDRGICFQPRMGPNSLKDGRQTFNFGDVAIYIDGGVVFALKEKEWQPLPLELLSTI